MDQSYIALEQNIQILISGGGDINQANTFILAVAADPSPSVWSAVVTIIVNNIQSPQNDYNKAYFALTLLHMKVKLYWKQLPESSREDLLRHLLDVLNQANDMNKVTEALE